MDNPKKAVFIGEQASGTAVAIGREDKEEWLKSKELPALDLENVR